MRGLGCWDWRGKNGAKRLKKCLRRENKTKENERNRKLWDVGVGLLGFQGMEYVGCQGLEKKIENFKRREMERQGKNEKMFASEL